MTDDDIRDVLRAKAREATVSDDAWERIAARLGEADHPVVRHLPRRLLAVGAAAAVVAGVVVVANNPGPTSQVASSTTTSAVQLPPPGVPTIESAVSAWLASRVPGFDIGVPSVAVTSDTRATVTFPKGKLATELLVRRGTLDEGWAVVSATSDLLLLDNPTYDGAELVAEAVPAVEGSMTVTYVVDGVEMAGGTREATHETQHLGYPVAGAERVAVRIVLRTADGTTAVVEQQAQVLRDPATVEGSYVAVWPATDSVGLASLQQQADRGRRDDLLDPVGVAGAFLSELLPRGETPTSFGLGDFQLGDPSSGEVPYHLADGADGTILLRRTGGDGSIWYVVGATSASLDVLQVRHEGTDLVADIQSSMDGTLTWTGAASIPVRSAQKVSIGRPGSPPEGSYPIVVRLMDGARTLALVARLS